MTVLRSLLFAAIFYLGTVLYVLAGIIAMPFGRRPTLAIILGWIGFHTGGLGTPARYPERSR